MIIALFLSCAVVATQVSIAKVQQTSPIIQPQNLLLSQSLRSSTSLQWPACPVASRRRGSKCIGAWGVDPPQQPSSSPRKQIYSPAKLNKHQTSPPVPPDLSNLDLASPSAAWPTPTPPPFCPSPAWSRAITITSTLLPTYPSSAKSNHVTISISFPSICQLSCHLISPSSWLTSEEQNSLIRALLGNRNQQGKGIKCLVWNKGSSLLQNKHLEI